MGQRLMETREPQQRHPVLISFSGIDGAGKSTQIEHLESELARSGRRSYRLAFWDDVVVLKSIREGVTHKVFKSEKGIGAPGRPVMRRDKNVRAWYLSLFRSAFYLLDAIHLRLVVKRALRMQVDVIIFDRYLHDELANLSLENAVARAYIRFLAWLAPRPELAMVLDADPAAACLRKPEYPVQFAERCRRTYLDMAALLGMTIIAPQPLPQAKAAVWTVARRTLVPPIAEERQFPVVARIPA
jgi:thymidylate kinase